MSAENYWDHELEYDVDPDPDPEDDLCIAIYADSEDELMTELEDLSVPELKILLASVNRMYQHKAYKSPLYGVGHPKHGNPTSDTLTVEDFKRAQDALVKANVPMVSWSIVDDYSIWSRPSVQIDSQTIEVKTMAGFSENYNTHLINQFNSLSSLDCCSVPCAAPIKASPCKVKSNQIKETTPMYTETQQKANFLTNELEGIYYSAEAQIYDKFNQHDVRPKNAKQAREWVAAGGLAFVGDDDVRYYTQVWSDPTKPRDDAGFKVAQTALTKAYVDTVRTIKIVDPTAGLDALKAFETANLIAN